jgi:outer membrane protease
MADTVTTQTIADTSGVKFVAKLTNFSDGTGETLVKKIDASELTFMTEDGNRKISKLWFSVNTANPKSAVELIWDGVANATAIFLSGQGHFDFRPSGDEIPNNATTPTGDVLLSTKNFASGDNYTIIVEFR